jgi:hypothetical protein
VHALHDRRDGASIPYARSLRRDSHSARDTEGNSGNCAGIVGWGGYWEVAAVGSVFEVAICAAMGALEVASV